LSFQFNPLDGLVIVDAELHGPSRKELVHVALDTGATTTVIDLGMLGSLGYDPESASQTSVLTGSGVAYASLIALPRIIALGRERSDFPVLAHTLPAGAGVGGVLGLDFLRGLIVTLDFRAGQIEIA
jgi:predicted aspartyl protease